MVKIRVLPPMPILKDFHRNYRSAQLMDNFKLIYRYDKERDEIVIADIGKPNVRNQEYFATSTGNY